MTSDFLATLSTGNYDRFNRFDRQVMSDADADAVINGYLSLDDAREIATKRALLEGAFEADLDACDATEQRVRRTCGSQQLNCKGLGARTLGAKAHGKAALPASGAGYGNYRRERLHRLA
jgi:hypothetical protein